VRSASLRFEEIARTDLWEKYLILSYLLPSPKLGKLCKTSREYRSGWAGKCHLVCERKNLCIPPTFCRIPHVLPSSPAPEGHWSVTAADRRRATVTDDLDVEGVQTYEPFQTALLLKNARPLLQPPQE
jgi:hypothetical protein